MIGRWFGTDHSPDFGKSVTRPMHNQRSISCSTLIISLNTFTIYLIICVSFFHQKLVILSGPAELQFFFLRIEFQHTSVVITKSPSYTFVTSSENLSLISLIHVASGLPKSSFSHKFRQNSSTESGSSKYRFSTIFSLYIYRF